MNTSSIKKANPYELFGEDVAKGYRALAKVFHPDTGGDVEMFQALQEKYDTFMPLTKITVNGDDYPITRWLSDDGVCTSYLVKKHDRVYIAKTNNYVGGDEHQLEFDFIETLYKVEPTAFHHIPKPIACDNQSSLYEIIVSPKHFWSLERVANGYNYALPEKAIGWIWRRFLTAMSILHDNGFVHGHINTNCVYLNTESHDMYLMGFYFSSREGNPIQNGIEGLEYPPESSLKSNPTGAWDIYMTSSVILSVTKDLPSPMLRYFQSLKAQAVSVRDYTFRELHPMWESVIFDQLGWKREFVPFVDKPSMWEIMRGANS